MEKWGGHPHYRGAVSVLGDDEHGTWVWGPAGRTIYRGDEALFDTEWDMVALTPPGAWWALEWWIGHPQVALYVNINTPVERDGDRLVCVDLDLDVIRFTDERVELVDRDEFELHKTTYGYPDVVIAGAEAAAAAALDLLTRDEPPFDGLAAGRWTAQARGSA